MTATRDNYPELLRRELETEVEQLDLAPGRKRYMAARWLDQLVWAEKRAAKARARLTTVVGAVLVPALVALGSLDGRLGTGVRVTTWVVSLIVAVSAAIEEFFHFGERWRHYRATAEQLKTEGWQFFQLAGIYAENGSTHAAAYPQFAARTEALIQRDVDTWVTQLTAEQKSEHEAAT